MKIYIVARWNIARQIITALPVTPQIVVLLLAALNFFWDLVIGMYDSRKELVDLTIINVNDRKGEYELKMTGQCVFS